MLEHVMTRKIFEQIRKQHTAYYKHNKLHKTLQYNYYENTINYLTYNKPYKLIKGTKRIEERRGERGRGNKKRERRGNNQKVTCNTVVNYVK